MLTKTNNGRKPQVIDAWMLQYVERQQVIKALKTLREEWEEAADGRSLHMISGNVGMILDDLARMLELTPEECSLALGHSLE
jgi:hypothetical protein